MPTLINGAFDSGLSYLDTNGTRIDICSQEPTTYSQATTAGTYSLGNKTGLNTGAPADGAVDGRRVTVPAITDGSVTTTGTATHWALTDNASLLLATGPLTASQAVTSGNTFTLDAIIINYRDPTAV
jgi:hypothetical protein